VYVIFRYSAPRNRTDMNIYPKPLLYVRRTEQWYTTYCAQCTQRTTYYTSPYVREQWSHCNVLKRFKYIVLKRIIMCCSSFFIRLITSVVNHFFCFLFKVIYMRHTPIYQNNFIVQLIFILPCVMVSVFW
jgi:hypothetical protein